MKRLEVRLTGLRTRELVVGHLIEREGRLFFQYDTSFLESGLDLSPYKLPFQAELTEHRDQSFGPLPGLFDDSLPDGWGLLLMDRFFRKQGLDPSSLTVLDRLGYLGTRTMGALTYHPCQEWEGATPLDLARIHENAQAILEGSAREVLPELFRAGGSPGGARPKILVGVSGSRIISGESNLPDDYEPWIIKFPGKHDDKDAGRIEYAYALMAKAAGLEISSSRLFETSNGHSFFGTKRFDRMQGRRLHVHTFGNMIHANFRIPGCDYADVLKVTRRLTQNQKDVEQVFRLMLFNVYAHNRDDHAKNFSYLMDANGQWSFSPAYDLTFSQGPGGEHSMTVNGEGQRPSESDYLELANASAISDATAKSIMVRVQDAIKQWPAFAGKAGLSKEKTRTLRKKHQT